jgi:hypothetical protein
VFPRNVAQGSSLPVHVVVDGGRKGQGAFTEAQLRDRLGSGKREVVVHSLQQGKPGRRVIGDLNISSVVITPLLDQDGQAAPQTAASAAASAAAAVSSYFSCVHDVISGAIPQRPSRIFFLAATPHGRAPHQETQEKDALVDHRGLGEQVAVIAGAVTRSYAASLRAETAHLGVSVNVVHFVVKGKAGEDEGEVREAERILMSLIKGEWRAGADFYTSSALWTIWVLRRLPEWARKLL